jgi:hypothetical protein
MLRGSGGVWGGSSEVQKTPRKPDPTSGGSAFGMLPLLEVAGVSYCCDFDAIESLSWETPWHRVGGIACSWHLAGAPVPGSSVQGLSDDSLQCG